MKKIILLICFLILIVGCTDSSYEELMELLDEDNTRLDARYERIQEEWDLRDKTNMTCVFNECMGRCNTPCIINSSYDPFCFDNNNDSKIDGFEYEIMESALERSRNCNYNCFRNDWKYMDECRLPLQNESKGNGGLLSDN